MLTEAKISAGVSMFGSRGTSVEWHGIEFVVAARGAKGYEWVLRNDDVMVCIAAKAFCGNVMPEIYVTFSSQYLWAVGYKTAFNQVYDWILGWAEILDNKVSRCDLCMDIAMPMPVIDTAKEMRTRARHRTEYIDTSPDVVLHYGGRRVTDYTVGNGNLHARLYDKTTEIVIHHKEWFRDIWEKQGWDGKETVVRCEFQCRRNFLKEMSTCSFEDLEYTLTSIWNYCTHEWLRICDVGSKTNQSRWKEKAYWKLIQNSTEMFGKVYLVPRMKVKKVKVEHLIQQVKGILVSICAINSDAYGIDGSILMTLLNMKDLLKSPDFKTAVKWKTGQFGNIKKNKNHLIDEILKMGGVIEAIEDNILRAEADKDSLN